MLSLRLQPVLQEIISENQSAFTAGRAISDNVLITHEVLHYLKMSQAQVRCTMEVKTDMSKAYDRVEWSFLTQVMQRMRFHSIWINWIKQCIATVSYSYLINDTSQGSVIPQRGIRQGDPLSAYLFILCGEVLSGLCTRAKERGTLRGIKVARNCPEVNHLLFADDTMFFCQATKENCITLKAILLQYEEASGQRINKDKSSITFSTKTPKEKRDMVKEMMEIQKEGGSGKYLGLPEHFGRRKRDLFTSIVDRIRQRAATRSTRFLSKAGKLTMLKSVLTPIPVYSMSCFELPASLCKRIQSVLTRYWWDDSEEKKKMCWVSWDKMTKTKAEGGLGFRDIHLFNQALLAKQTWRIITKPNCLLARILLGKYCHKQSILNVEAPSACSHGWRSILHGRDLLKGYLGKAIGNGQTTRVWQDSWISLTEQVKPYGPIPEADLDLTVADLLTDDMQWNTKRVKEILPLFEEQILRIQPSQAGTEDIIIWQPSSSGIYSTKSGYSVASRARSHIIEAETFDWIKDVWSSHCSPKMKVFTWSIIQRALPLGDNLQNRGIKAQEKCIRCNELETTKHIFFECPFAKEVWKRIPIEKEVIITSSMDFKDAVIAFGKSICLPPSGITSPILAWICWSLWIARNNQIFKKRLLTQEEVATKGIRLAREWSSAQSPKIKGNKGLPRDHLHKTSRVRDPRTLICRTDASWDKSTGKAGLAWIISEGTSNIKKQGATTQEFVASPLVAEALALRLGIIAAGNLDLQKIMMLSDNQTLIRAINNGMQIKEIYGIVKDIQQISSAFTDISFCFLPRLEIYGIVIRTTRASSAST